MLAKALDNTVTTAEHHRADPLGADAGGDHRRHLTKLWSLQNIIGLIPLALILGEITEDLAVRFGPTIGGLLNATFGNVVELILSIVALTKGLYTVVASSLVGSILSNLLLVLGKLMWFLHCSSFLICFCFLMLTVCLP